ncbi:bacteriohemerythrin [Pseudodesulfovibrio nedwellii]|uniref:bacteriohemerythrin n=1 Tax=Pseudodesulfovibrio nedwellii TaxID=2973072 RepID=UPI002492A52C|nr:MULTISPECIES: bacteriohemerythrin [Pseudodesulfovibrio]
MNKLEWSPELSVGQKDVDEQHKELIRIANGLINAVSIGRGKRTIQNVVQKLREYTVFHFSNEEGMMEQMRFPERGQHAAEHLRLKLLVKNYQRKLYKNENVNAEEVLDFMKDWLLGHILTFDRGFATYIVAFNEAEKAKEFDAPEVVDDVDGSSSDLSEDE